MNRLSHPRFYFSVLAGPALFLLLSAGVFAQGLYQVPSNIFGDYKPAHQRPNPGADWQRMKAAETARVEREFDAAQKRARSYQGTIDNRDYSRVPRSSGYGYGKKRGYDLDFNANNRQRSRANGSDYGYRAPAARNTPRGIPPGYSRNALAGQQPAGRKERDNARYYGTRSGESLYPYNAKNSRAAQPPTGRAPAYKPPKDPSRGGNRAWNIPAKNRVDTRRYYQDEIAKYRREHRPKAWCSDGSISGRGSGACAGHGGLLRRS